MDQLVPNKNTKSKAENPNLVKRSGLTFSLILCLATSVGIFSQPNSPKSKKKENTKLIILSIDGFLGSYFESPEILKIVPNLKEFSERSAFSYRIKTVNPSVTYPAHTSMITGVDPGIHGIYNNTPLDPFEKNDGGWTWYAEDIKVETLWDLARGANKTVGNVFWPVTVGAEIKYNLPQYWRKKIPEDDKLLRALSTKGLHRLAESYVGSPLNDMSKDQVKFRTALWMYESFHPDLLLVYTTDLDTIHHGYGTHSEKAKEKLKEIDFEFGEFIKSLKLYERRDLALILISDHGFHSAKHSCAPNLYLLKKGFIHADEQKFDFIFKSSGGTALLLPGTRSPSIEELAVIERDLLSECPGAIWTSLVGNSNLKLQHPDAIALLSTRAPLYFSGSRKGEIFSESKTSIHGHGYDAEMREMETIGGVYWKGMKDKEAWKLVTVKDAFNRAKEILSLTKRKKN